MIEELARAAHDPGTHQYPSNRGRPELREAFARFYERRFGVELDPDAEIVPALGAKECVFNLNLAFLDPDSVALAADPGYPVYTGGPLLAGAEAVLMPLVPELGFAPDLDAIGGEVAARARLLYLNYPNNPTGAVVPDGLFERAVEFGREHGILIVHDASYTETTFDGYVAPSFLETPGAKDVGVEVFSLSKGWNMTGWRTAAIVGNAGRRGGLLEAEDEHRLGRVRGGAAGCRQGARRRAACRDGGDLRAPPRPGLRRPARDRRGRDPAEGHDLRLGAGARGPHLGFVLRARARGVGRRGLSRGAYGPNGEGFFRISLTVADERLSEAVERLRGSLGAEEGAVHYCGVIPMQGALQLAMLEEVRARAADPVERDLLRARLGAQVAASCARWATVVVAVGAPLAEPREGRPGRDCDALLLRLGGGADAGEPRDPHLADLLRELPTFAPEDSGSHDGPSTRAPTTGSRSSRPTPTACSARCRAAGCRPSAIRSGCRCGSRSSRATT